MQKEKKIFLSRAIVVKVEGQMKRGTKCDLSAAQLMFKGPLKADGSTNHCGLRITPPQIVA